MEFSSMLLHEECILKYLAAVFEVTNAKSGHGLKTVNLGLKIYNVVWPFSHYKLATIQKYFNRISS